MSLQAATLCVALLLGSGRAAAVEPFDPYAGPRPVAVLLDTNPMLSPWLTAVGSYTPIFVLYENRLAIRLQRTSGEPGYEHVAQTLSESTYRAFLDRLRALTSGAPWKASYDAAPDITHMSSVGVYLNIGEKLIATQVTGLDVTGVGDPTTDARLKRAAAEVPANLRLLVEELRTKPVAFATRWTPGNIEVTLWPHDNAPGPSIRWPRTWPGLESTRSRKRRGDGYSIYLPGDELDAVRQFMSSLKSRGAVHLGRRKWAAEFRFVFPSEPEWQQALSSRGP